MSQGLRGRSVPSTPQQPTPSVNPGSPTAATPSKTLLTLAKTLLTLLQKGLTSRGSSLGERIDKEFLDRAPRVVDNLPD
jgi:gamma-glutamylcysteine synthetase